MEYCGVLACRVVESECSWDGQTVLGPWRDESSQSQVPKVPSPELPRLIMAIKHADSGEMIDKVGMSDKEISLDCDLIKLNMNKHQGKKRGKAAERTILIKRSI